MLLEQLSKVDFLDVGYTEAWVGLTIALNEDGLDFDPCDDDSDGDLAELYGSSQAWADSGGEGAGPHGLTLEEEDSEG
jgi:hypothetical protein